MVIYQYVIADEQNGNGTYNRISCHTKKIMQQRSGGRTLKQNGWIACGKNRLRATLINGAYNGGWSW